MPTEPALTLELTREEGEAAATAIAEALGGRLAKGRAGSREKMLARILVRIALHQMQEDEKRAPGVSQDAAW